jgi:hypothetical protein
MARLTSAVVRDGAAAVPDDMIYRMACRPTESSVRKPCTANSFKPYFRASRALITIVGEMNSTGTYEGPS